MNLRTLAATKLLGALGLVAVAALGWVLVLEPRTAVLADVRDEITTTRDQNDVLQGQLVELERQAARLDDVRVDARDLAATFPPTADQPGVFRDVTAAAAAAGIGPQDLTALSPTAPVVSDVDPVTGLPLAGEAANLARQTLSVTVLGSYDETAQLLANLERMPRAFLVASVALTGAEGGYTTTIEGDMFAMPPVEEPPPGISGGGR